MAKFEKSIYSLGFDELTDIILRAVRKGSATSTMEDRSDFFSGGARCRVMVFERYSMAGKNRVSMTVTLFQGDQGPIHVSAITAGGSTGLFMKWNTIGEQTFLSTLTPLLSNID